MLPIASARPLPSRFVALTKKESSDRLCQAMRRREEFLALATAVRDGRLGADSIAEKKSGPLSTPRWRGLVRDPQLPRATEQVCQVAGVVIVDLQDRDEVSRLGHAKRQVALAVVLAESHHDFCEP
jgi:hypothetical protein